MPRVANCGFESGDLLTANGPAILVRIDLAPNFVTGAIPTLNASEYHALVDTGAHESCIDSGIAQSLGLPVVDAGTIAGAHGVEVVNHGLA